jgi:hypothetical protein
VDTPGTWTTNEEKPCEHGLLTCYYYVRTWQVDKGDREPGKPGALGPVELSHRLQPMEFRGMVGSTEGCKGLLRVAGAKKCEGEVQNGGP